MPFAFTCLRCGVAFERRHSKPARFCGHACVAEFYGTGHMGGKAAEVGDRRRGTGRGDGYVKRGGRHEHRVVAEQMLGRPLAPGEIVAHRDQRKPNNSPDNLIVFSSRSDFSSFIGKLKRKPPPCASSH